MSLVIEENLFYTLRERIEARYIQKQIASKNLRQLRAENPNIEPEKGKGGFRRTGNRISDLSINTQYKRKVARAEVISEIMKTDPDFAIFINWIKSIQIKLNLSTKDFAYKIGLRDKHCPGRMLRHYYNLKFFPSEETYQGILRMERRSKIKIKIINDVTNIKGKGITKNIKVPSLSSRKNGNNHLNSNVSN